jgi:multiple sugar transport system substrate-binding protein
MKNFCRGLTAAAFATLFGLPALAADPVTIHFWVAWDPQQADAIAARKEIDAYEQSHPGVKIDVQNITYDALHN